MCAVYVDTMSYFEFWVYPATTIILWFVPNPNNLDLIYLFRSDEITYNCYYDKNIQDHVSHLVQTNYG